MRGFVWMAIASVALIVGGAWGQPVPASVPVPRVVFPITPSGNTLNLGPVTANAANAANFSFGVAANGGVFANTGSRLPTPGGGAVDINVGGGVGKAAVGAALGRFLGKALPLLSTGLALYDLAKELSFTASNAADGTPVFRKDLDGGQCDTSGGGASGLTGYGDTTTWVTAHAQLCPDSRYVCDDIYTTNPPPANTCTMQIHPKFQGEYQSVFTWAVKPLLAVAQSTPATQQEFLDAVAAKSGWPSTSALARTLVDAIKAGEAVEVQPTSVTGPATDPNPVVSKLVDPIANTTTTTTTTNNYSYGPSSVTMTTTTTNQTVNNSTGAITNNTTQTVNAPVPNVPVTPTVPKPDAPIPCGADLGTECNVKVDERSTDTDPKLDAKTAATDATKDAKDFATSPAAKAPVHPGVSWSFALPSGCTVIQLPAFAPFMTGIDVCQFQGMFHELMTLVWIMGGLFGAISMFWRNALSLG